MNLSLLKSELDHDGVPEAGLVLPQIRAEACASCNTSEARRRGQERTWRPRCRAHHGAGSWVWNCARSYVVAGCDPAATSPVRHIGVSVTIFRAESNVLPWHPIERE